MIFEDKLIISGIETTFLTFTSDDPPKEFFEISELATQSVDPLANNYKSPIHMGKELTTVVVVDGKPFFMFATERDHPTLPANVVRAFNRAYMNPTVRALNFGTGVGKFTENFKYFYNIFPQYHQALGANTLFITRNYRIKNRQEKGLEQYFKSMNFVKYPHLLIYNECPQWFFVNGDSSFCDTLPRYIE